MTCGPMHTSSHPHPHPPAQSQHGALYGGRNKLLFSLIRPPEEDHSTTTTLCFLSSTHMTLYMKNTANTTLNVNTDNGSQQPITTLTNNLKQNDKTKNSKEKIENVMCVDQKMNTNTHTVMLPRM